MNVECKLTLIYSRMSHIFTGYFCTICYIYFYIKMLFSEFITISWLFRAWVYISLQIWRPFLYNNAIYHSKIELLLWEEVTNLYWILLYISHLNVLSLVTYRCLMLFHFYIFLFFDMDLCGSIRNRYSVITVVGGVNNNLLSP